ncbi:hypothetical protein PAL_GLEAN10013609 [Pteropus alecto]|uniref:Uncharacterized protein n=1 Tax=Pteropus alecto TaxID=9402 RepID=L5JW57_PTEAL|nr:hypothetical protein PAL_GLEAN10013609 [Pteropus alecto]
MDATQRHEPQSGPTEPTMALPQSQSPQPPQESRQRHGRLVESAARMRRCSRRRRSHVAARRAGMTSRRVQETTLSWPRPGPALAPARPHPPAPKAGPQILLSFPALCGFPKPKECLGPFIPLITNADSVQPPPKEKYY